MASSDVLQSSSIFQRNFGRLLIPKRQAPSGRLYQTITVQTQKIAASENEKVLTTRRKKRKKMMSLRLDARSGQRNAMILRNAKDKNKVSKRRTTMDQTARSGQTILMQSMSPSKIQSSRSQTIMLATTTTPSFTSTEVMTKMLTMEAGTRKPSDLFSSI